MTVRASAITATLAAVLMGATAASAQPSGDNNRLGQCVSMSRTVDAQVLQLEANDRALTQRRTEIETFRAEVDANDQKLTQEKSQLEQMASQLDQQRADTAGFAPARRVVIGGRIDELLMLGPDSPAIGGFFPTRETGDELVARFDDRRVAVRNRLRRHARPLSGY